MIMKRVNRSDPERIFIIGYNSSADAWANGYPVRWDYSTDINGVGMEKPAAVGTKGRSLVTIAGVVADTIGSGAYGLVQVWGFHSAVRVHEGTGGTTLAAGVALVAPTAAQYALEAVPVTGTKAHAYPVGFCFEGWATYTTTTKKCFIKCL